MNTADHLESFMYNRIVVVGFYCDNIPEMNK